MNINHVQSQECITNYLHQKTAPNPLNNSKRLVIEKTANQMSLAFRELTFFEKVCSLLGMGSASFKNVVHFINENKLNASLTDSQKNEFKKIISLYNEKHWGFKQVDVSELTSRMETSIQQDLSFVEDSLRLRSNSEGKRSQKSEVLSLKKDSSSSPSQKTSVTNSISEPSNPVGIGGHTTNPSGDLKMRPIQKSIEEGEEETLVVKNPASLPSVKITEQEKGLSPVVEKTKNNDFDLTIFQTTESKTVHPYPGDLTPAQCAELGAEFKNEFTFFIGFRNHPNFRVTIRRQDLFESGANVIVNAANSHLGGGGGIDGAVNDQGGKEYQAAHQGALKNQYKSNYTSGHAALITSGDLKNKYKDEKDKHKNIENVIVVAGPMGKTNSDKENSLYSCYLNSLLLAHEKGKKSIGFPSISTGIYGFDKDRAAEISLRAIYDFVQKHPDSPLQTISIHFRVKEGGVSTLPDLKMYEAAVNKLEA